MPKDVADSDEFRGARFTRVDLSGATLRDVDLTDAKIVDAVLVNTDVSGLIIGMRVNGVDVAPLVEAELDRRHPERVVMRASTASACATAGRRSRRCGTRRSNSRRDSLNTRHQRVDNEWSLVETLRHLIFVTDATTTSCGRPAARMVGTVRFMDEQCGHHRRQDLETTWRPVGDLLGRRRTTISTTSVAGAAAPTPGVRRSARALPVRGVPARRQAVHAHWSGRARPRRAPGVRAASPPDRQSRPGRLEGATGSCPNRRSRPG